MASWTSISTSSLLPGKPLTSALGLALEENPRAIAEQATDAPKIADKIVSGAVTSISNAVITDLGDFGGLLLFGCYNGTGSGNAQVEYSLNGTTWAGLTTFAAYTSASSGALNFFLDFSSGDWQSAYFDGTNPQSGSGTIASTSGLMSLRFSITSANSDYAFLAKPQGGQSAS